MPDSFASSVSLERWLTELWEDVLLVSVGVDDNFFALGGNSIKAVRVMNRLQEATQAMFHPAILFDAPTVSALAAYCREHYADVFSPVGQAQAGTAPLSNAQIAQAQQHLLRRQSAGVLQSDKAARNPPAIFILSPPRSGSTLLRVMLGGHPQLFCPPELYLLGFDNLQQRREHFSGRLAFFRDGLIRALMALHDCSQAAAETRMVAMEQAGLTSRECFRHLQGWVGQRRVVDKTPSYAFNPMVLQALETGFENALFIHLVRHPLATVCSYEELRAEQVTRQAEEDLPLSLRQKGELWWQISHQNILDFLQTVPEQRQHCLHYEDLVAAPETAMHTLCDFMGIAFHPDMLHPYQGQASRMTDGVSADSRVLGDQKFRSFKTIETASLERWKEQYHHDFLCEASWVLAEQLGYTRSSFAAEERDEREEWEL